jgi:uncharacterized repeat protein (TIGR01451 family)
MHAEASAAQGDSDPTDDAATDKAAAVAVADLGVTATAPAGPIAAGQDTEFRLDVHNDGPSDAAGVVITHTLPAGAVIVDLDARCSQDGQVVTCRLGSVATGADAGLTFRVHADQAFDGAALGAGAAVSAASQDGNAANDVLAPAAVAAKVPTSCLSRRVFTIHLRLPHQKALRNVKVTVDGKSVKVRKGKRLTAVIDLRGRFKTPRVLVKITATTRAGKKIVGTRAYKTCDLRIVKKKAPKV